MNVPVAAARDRAFRALVAQVHEPLTRYLIRRASVADAEDVLAETLLVLWRRLDDVPVEEPLPWCYGVAARVLANARRGERRRQALAHRIAIVDPPASIPAPEDRMEGCERAEEVRAALAGLPESDREVLRLWAWESLAPAQIAVALGITPNAASIRLHRARGRLRAALEGTESGARDAGGGDPGGKVPGSTGQDGGRRTHE